MINKQTTKNTGHCAAVVTVKHSQIDEHGVAVLQITDVIASVARAKQFSILEVIRYTLPLEQELP